MDRSDADQLNPLMSRVPEDNSRDNRPFPLPACVSSGLAAVISVFCIGLVSGAAGGLLLGGTAVVMLQSLELLADNRLLMDQLEKHIMDNVYYIKYNNIVYDIHISVLAVMFGVFSSTLSLAAGIYIGLSTYSLVIKKKGEAAMGKALKWAGPVCVSGVTATGYILGLTLESFLTIIFNRTMSLCFLISVPVTWLVVPMITEICCQSHNCDPIICWFFTPLAAGITFLISSLCKIRIYLVAILIPTIMAVRELGKSQSFKLTNVSVPLMLIISDVYYIAGWQIVSLQSPTSTNLSSAVVEAIFVGVLASLLWTVTVGMSLFVSWQRGGAFNICAAAAGSGTTVLGAVKLALPVLGPGPTIGALIGVAGAVGVSLSAAGAATDQYGLALERYGVVGRLGLAVGTVVGAFLSSCAHSGLSGMFMALCAATIPAGAFLRLFFQSIPSDSRLGQIFLFLWLSTSITYIYGLIAFNRIISFEIVECKFLLCSILVSLFCLLL